MTTENSVTTEVTDWQAKYKDLQRTAQKQQKALADRLAAAMGFEEMKSRVERMEEMLGGIYTIIGKADAFSDTREDVTKTVQSVETKRKSQDELRKSHAELSKLVSDSGMEWDDEKLSPVRAAWEKGNLDDALRLARNLSTTDDSQITAQVTKILKEKFKLDMTAPAPTVTDDKSFMEKYSAGQSDDHERAAKILGLLA